MRYRGIEISKSGGWGMKKKVSNGCGGRSTGDSNENHSQITFGPGTASPGYGIQETLQEVNQVTQRKNSSTRNVEVVTRAQKAREEWAQTSGLEGKAGDRSCHLKAQCGRTFRAAAQR